MTRLEAVKQVIKGNTLSIKHNGIDFVFTTNVCKNVRDNTIRCIFVNVKPVYQNFSVDISAKQLLSYIKRNFKA